MKLYAFVFILNLFFSQLAMSSDTNATPPKFSSTLQFDSLVENQFSEFPKLAPVVVQFANDPEIPDELKTFLTDVLAIRDLKIHRLDPAVAEAYKLPEGFSGQLKPKIKVVVSEESNNRNDQIEKSVAALRTGQPQLFDGQNLMFCKDGVPNVESINPLFVCMHELAHIKFLQLAHLHEADLMQNFPRDMVWRERGGQMSIESDLWQYLIERFANEIEAQLYVATYRGDKYFRVTPSQWSPFRANSLNFIRGEIPRLIRLFHNLRDPRLVFMDSMSVPMILQDGLPKNLWKRN